MMTTFYLVRHGNYNYNEVVESGFKGHSFEFAPLSELGIKQANECSLDERFKNAQLIISSPYTRALQTAAIIGKNTCIDILVELDLRERDFDTQHKIFDFEEYMAAAKASLDDTGSKQSDLYIAETLDDVKIRVLNILKKYTNYNNIIVVCHGFIIYALTESKDLFNCSIHEYVIK